MWNVNIMDRLLLICLLSLVNDVSSETTTEFVALAYTSGNVLWQEVSYPSNYTVTSASDVTINLVEGSNDVIGELQDLNMGGPPLLTVRASGSDLYAQLNTGIAPKGGTYPGGCCVDLFKKFETNGNIIEWDLQTIIIEALGNYTEIDPNTNLPYVYANHVFDMITSDDDENSMVALLDIVYIESELNGTIVNGVAMFDLSTGKLIPTKNGDGFYSFYKYIGTTSTNAADSIYKIQYTNATSASDGEQYHQNGLSRFMTKDGTWVIGSTHLLIADAVLIKCPYTYTVEEGGGQILQRFGSPQGHTFGLKQKEAKITGMHNVHYTLYPDGQETVTLFVNSQNGVSMSQVYEFDIKLTPEPTSTTYDDTIFATSYVKQTLNFMTHNWGGARPIGQGVWLIGFKNVTVADQNMTQGKDSNVIVNSSDQMSSSIYDPFAVILS